MLKRKIWIVCIVLLILALLAGAAWCVYHFGFQTPYANARSHMSSGDITVRQEADGRLLMSWPKAEGADFYCVEFFLPGQDAPYYKAHLTSNENYQLPYLPQDQELTLRIRTGVNYKNLKEQLVRYSENVLQVTTSFAPPQVQQLAWTADPDQDIVTISYTIAPGDHCRVYTLDEHGNPQYMYTADGMQTAVTFGEGKDLPFPGHQDIRQLVFDAYRSIPGFQFFGYQSAQMQIVRDDLLGRELNMKCNDLGHNQYCFTWNETKGDSYQVQLLNNDGTWTPITDIAQDGALIYTTGHLPIFSTFRYRVVALGGEPMEGSEYAAEASGITVTTKESTIYATIWPIAELDAYETPESTACVNKVTTGQAYCVLEEENGRFGILLDGELRYIDSNYCMINLPEFIGNLCQYNITNSYDCMYMVHEFEIPTLTGERILGYEYVQQKSGSYLVPLLYPTAKKLVNAAYAAQTEGYTIRIYDAFRPHKTTKEIYAVTEKLLKFPIPENPYRKDVRMEDLNLPAPALVDTVDENGNPVQKEAVTYQMVMTTERYGLSSFLAKGGSMHNLGIAMDLTIVSVETGKELEMQTSIHDLSAYSVTSVNNKYARKLAEIMKEAGFATLVSEWWHFQDNEARENLSPPSVWGGISAECWMATNDGWRYRTRRGEFYKNKTVKIGGVEYTFDENGYVQGEILPAT